MLRFLAMVAVRETTKYMSHPTVIGRRNSLIGFAGGVTGGGNREPNPGIPKRSPRGKSGRASKRTGSGNAEATAAIAQAAKTSLPRSSHVQSSVGSKSLHFIVWCLESFDRVTTANDPDHRSRANDSRSETTALSRDSVHPVCYLERIPFYWILRPKHGKSFRCLFCFTR
jgi:hypothetical protein